MSELVAFQIFNSFNLQHDDETFGYVQSSFAFMFETDVGINGLFAPFGFSGHTS